MTDTDAIVGAKAKAARDAAGLSLRDVNRALPDVPGTDPSAMSERERGARPWTVEQVVKVAPLYGVDPSALLPDSDDDNTDPMVPQDHDGEERPRPYGTDPVVPKHPPDECKLPQGDEAG